VKPGSGLRLRSGLKAGVGSGLLLVLLCFLVIELVAAEKPPPSPKLTDLLAAKGEDGKPVITSEQRAYFDALNDRIRELFNGVAEAEIITRPDHLGSILALGLRPQKMEVLLQDNCVLCHTDPEVQKPGTLFVLPSGSNKPPVHLNLRDVVDDVHFARGLSCAGCHGGDPANAKLEHSFVKEWPGTGRDKNREWIPAFCARCHSDPGFMKNFNPTLPTDQFAKFKDSPHGKRLLEGKDSRAAQCVSCHGVHGIRNAKNPLSLIYRKRIPETCAACHSDGAIMAGFKRPDGSPIPTNQLAEYRVSVHGRAVLERGDFAAPACNNCHGNHSGMPAGLASVNQSCSLCHAGNASLFDGSKHKQAFEKHNWPECVQCHGNHGITKAHDGMLEPGTSSPCYKCHDQYAKDNPECSPSAAYFYTSITEMDRAWHRFTATAEHLAMKGLDVDPIHDKLNELADTVKQARSYIHSFSKPAFQRVVAPGGQAVQNISRLIDDAQAKYRARQIGLIVSIGLIGLVMVGLYLKIQQLER
jgi:hypothetical protein